MSRYDYRDPGLDPEYCDPLSRRHSLLPEVVICVSCDQEMPRPPVMSSRPLCPRCVDAYLNRNKAERGVA